MRHRQTCRLKTRNLTRSFLYDGTTCNDKELQQGRSEPYKMDLASDTGGHLLAKTLEPICLFGWWSWKALCVKQILSYSFWKTFSLPLQGITPLRLDHNSTFNSEIGMMRILLRHPCPFAQIVRNRGHGYDHSFINSRECVALSPLDSINPFYP